MREIALIVFVTTLGMLMSMTMSRTAHFQSGRASSPQTVVTSAAGWHKRQLEKRRCPDMPIQSKIACAMKAKNAGALTDNVNEELHFFKKCIADFFCFEKSANSDTWTKLPTFKGLIGTSYFNNAAKRVEMFFIRYNDWGRTMVDSRFRNVATGKCTNLLYITAARYLYVIHVLNLLRGDMTFGPCDVDSASGNLIVPGGGICFPVPYGNVTCTSDHDVGLIGARSGSLTALFNRFFRESVSLDPIVVGFGKSSEELFDTSVYAFTLEFAMPHIYVGLSTDFVTQIDGMNINLKYIVQEVVSAILKMSSCNSNYFNDLLSDQGELNKRATKHNLGKMFHDWRVHFQNLDNDVKSLLNSQSFSTQISFRHQQNIAYEMILGLIEGTEGTNYVSKAMSEIAIALVYAAEAYNTRGAIRHVVGWTQMKREDVYLKITLNDYWVSMLENWADAVNEYNRECVVHSLLITTCLPKMSKYLWRMLDAMFAIRSRLSPALQGGLLEVDNAGNTGVRSIMSYWLIEVKRKGRNAVSPDGRLPNLPQSTTNLDFFLQAFSCTGQEKAAALSQTCMDAIQQKIRQYNRRLFINLMYSDPA